MKMNKTKRAQAALEFLTTYGWAFLVILIMIGALAYFGVLNPSNLVPDTCTAGDGFTCTEYQATANESNAVIEVILINTLESFTFDATTFGTALTIDETGQSSCGTPVVDRIEIAGVVAVDPAELVESGETIRITVECPAGLSTGERFVAQYRLVYKAIGKTLEKTLVTDVSIKAK